MKNTFCNRILKPSDFILEGFVFFLIKQNKCWDVSISSASKANRHCSKSSRRSWVQPLTFFWVQKHWIPVKNNRKSSKNSNQSQPSPSTSPTPPPPPLCVCVLLWLQKWDQVCRCQPARCRSSSIFSALNTRLHIRRTTTSQTVTRSVFFATLSFFFIFILLIQRHPAADPADLSNPTRETECSPSAHIFIFFQFLFWLYSYLRHENTTE